MHAPLYAPYQRIFKKIEHHVASISLHFMYINFVRIHQTLRITPAMAAGVTDHVWEMADIVALLDDGKKQAGIAGRWNDPIK